MPSTKRLSSKRDSSKRDSSKRDSSKRDSSKRDSSKVEVKTDVPADVQMKIKIIAFVISILIQCSILYYLYNLEDADCNCIRDWRHNYIKGFAVFVICIGLLGFATDIKKYKAFVILYGIIGLINAYAFFTYIGDLNATKCSCAVVKQPNLNSLMILYRWVLFIISIFAVLGAISLLTVGGTTKS